MKVRIETLIKHLKTQIALSVESSDWCYITKNEAKKCLELAEAEDILLSPPVHAEIEGRKTTMWYVCGECHKPIDNSDSFCRHCGRKVKWDGLPH